jgi:hypothetical protein
MTPDDVGTVEGKILGGNVRVTLCFLGRVCGFKFDREHWKKVVAGLSRTNSDKDRWFDSEFHGRHRVRLRYAAQPRKADVLVRVEIPAVLKPQVELLLAIVSRYRLRSKLYGRMLPPLLPPVQKPPPG